MISGKIDNITNNAPIHIMLTDEEALKIPFAGIKKIIIIPDGKIFKSGFAEFTYDNIPDSVYGIRCF